MSDVLSPGEKSVLQEQLRDFVSKNLGENPEGAPPRVRYECEFFETLIEVAGEWADRVLKLDPNYYDEMAMRIFDLTDSKPTAEAAGNPNLPESDSVPSGFYAHLKPSEFPDPDADASRGFIMENGKLVPNPYPDFVPGPGSPLAPPSAEAPAPAAEPAAPIESGGEPGNGSDDTALDFGDPLI